MSKAQQRFFLVRAGGDGEDEQYAIENGVAIIGFQEVPSLGGVNDYQWVPEPSRSLITPVLPGFFYARKFIWMQEQPQTGNPGNPKMVFFEV